MLPSNVNPVIRLATVSDAEAMLTIYTPVVEDTVVSFELEPPSIEEMTRRIEHTLRFYPWLVYVEGDELGGYAYAGPFRSRAAYQWAVEVSAYIEKKRRRIGIGRALYTSLFSVLAHQGFVSALAGIAMPNPASDDFHESMGFKHTGTLFNIGYKLGTWRDVGWWQRSLQSTNKSPTPPLGIQSIVGTAAFTEAIQAGINILSDERRESSLE